ncbi:MAG: tetratricopeptide repeat-containing sensor histidine kinase [Bacteroidales bacterium]|jgi:signal transduction histidine kinase/Flp pilus assembly protein TadD|nr:tetratricopeptide repeat-containing sensor histidine kinase [Bacteroidales bacterium]
MKKLITLLYTFIIIYNTHAQNIVQADSVMHLIEIADNNHDRCKLYNDLAEIYIYTSPKRSLKEATTALNYALKDNDLALKTRCYLNIGIALRHLGRYADAVDSLHNVLHYINDLKDETLAASILNQVGIVHYQLGHDTLSINAYKQSMEIRKRLADDKGVADILNNLGNFYNGKGNYHKALEYFFKSLEYDEKMNNRKGMMASYNNIGLAYQNMKEYKKSISYYTKAIEITEYSPNPSREASIYNNIGSVYILKSQFDSAIHYIEKSNNIYQELGLPYMMQRNYTNLGLIAEKKGELKTSIDYHNKSLEIAHYYKNESLIAGAHINISRIYMLEKRYNTALQELIKAEESIDPYKNINVTSKLFLGLANVYHHLGKNDVAYQYITRHFVLRDSIYNVEKHAITSKIEAQYESEKRIQRIKSLRQDQIIKDLQIDRQELSIRNWIVIASITLIILILVIAMYLNRNRFNKKLSEQNDKLNLVNRELNDINNQLIQSEEKLTEANATKDQLFSIISHDLKSPINRLQNLVFILKNRPESISEDDKNVYLNNLDDSLKGVNELLNNLLNWSVTQQNQFVVKYESINIAEVIDKNRDLFKSQIEDKKLKINVDSDKTILRSDYNMINFIVRNLIHNAIKFTPENGSITITHKTPDNNCVISVKDTGIGIPEEYINNLLTDNIVIPQRGTHNEKGTGIGLHVCNKFIIKLNGKFNIKSSNGSEFIVTLPIKEDI